MAGFNTIERIEEEGESKLILRRSTSQIVVGCFWLVWLGFFGLVLFVIWIGEVQGNTDLGRLYLITVCYLCICFAYLRTLRDRSWLSFSKEMLRIHRVSLIPWRDRIILASDIAVILRFVPGDLLWNRPQLFVPHSLEGELQSGERIPLTDRDDAGAINQVEDWLREKVIATHLTILWERRTVGTGKFLSVQRRPYRFPYSEKPPFEFDLGWHRLYSGARTIVHCDDDKLWVEERFWRKMESRYWQIGTIAQLEVDVTEEDWGDEKPCFANLVLLLRDGTTTKLASLCPHEYEEIEVLGWIAALLNRRLACEVSGTTDGESVPTVD